jgi:hypothetical protein
MMGKSTVDRRAELAVPTCGKSELWAYAWQAISQGRGPSPTLMNFVQTRHTSYYHPQARRGLLEAQVGMLSDQVLELNREVRDLRGRLRRLSSGEAIILEQLDLPDYPGAQVEAVAARVLEYLDAHGKTDVVDYAQHSGDEFWLVAQAFRLLEKRGQVMED